MPLSASKSDLKKLFGQYGGVEAVRFRSIAFTEDKMYVLIADLLTFQKEQSYEGDQRGL